MDVRLREVADHAGVSEATVSRVLNNYPHVRREVRERVLASVQELGYRGNHVARSMRRQSTSMIGFLARDSRNPNFATVYSAALERAEARGYSLLVCSSQGRPDAEARYIDLLVGHRVDGIVAYVADESTDNLTRLDEARIPYVLVETSMESHDADRVISNAAEGVRDATRHLLDLGHSGIGIVLGRDSSWPSHQRFSGFAAAFTDAGRAHDERLVRWCDETEAGSAQGVSELLDAAPGRLTAIVATTNLITTACVRELTRRGLGVPGDVSVVGFDDSDVARLYGPGLTVVRRDLEGLGAAPIDLLADRGTSGSGPRRPSRTVIIPCEVVLRGSTGPPPAAG